jgi:hypothetical protein
MWAIPGPGPPEHGVQENDRRAESGLNAGRIPNGEENMADNNSKDKPPARPADNEPEEDPIIELTDEIGSDDMLDLEKNLLALETEIGRSLGEDLDAEALLAEDPKEPDDISWLLEDGPASPAEAETPPIAAESGPATAEEPDLGDIDWLLRDLNKSASPGTDKIEEVLDSELRDVPEEDDEFLEAEEIPDEEAAEPAAALPGENEGPNILDIDETDDQLVWFDELDAPTAAAETPEAGGWASGKNDVDLILHADLPEPAEARPAPAPEIPPPPAAAAVLAAAVPAAGPPETPSEGVFPAEVSAEQIDAAVERLIEKKFGARIEAIVVEKISQAVLKEIERLKSILQDPDA